MKTRTEDRLYILMRSDLPSMTTGRAMAQASHAANAFIAAYGHLKTVKAWQKETLQGFGTAIVLAATLKDIEDILAPTLSEPHEMVTDPEYGIKINPEIYNLLHMRKINDAMTIVNDDGSVIVFRPEVTCAYVFGSKAALDPILGHLKLHP